MRNTLSLFILLALAASLSAQSLSEIESKRVILSNGWSITPVGDMVPLGDLPLNIAVSPSGKPVATSSLTPCDFQSTVEGA